MAREAPDSLERETVAAVTRRIIPLLFVLYVASFLDRTNVSLAALRMNQDVGLSAAAYGLGAGIFFIGYALFEVPSNLILVRVGARRWLARIAITWGLLASAMMFVQGPWSFYALRLLLGIAEAGYFPGVIFYLSQWFPERRRARAISMFMIGIPLSGVIGGPLGGALLGMQGRLGLAGWQWLFLVEGIPAVLLGFVVLRYLPDRLESATWLTDAQRTWLSQRLDTEQRAQAVVQETPGAALGDPTVWWLCIPYILHTTGAYAALLWLPVLVRDLLAISDQRVGFVTGAMGAAGMVAMLWNAAHSDRRDERVMHGAAGLGIAAAGFAIAAMVENPIVAVVGLAVAYTGNSAFLPAFWCLPSRFLRGAGAAAGIALINSIGNTGGFIGPNVLGAVKTATGGFTVALGLIAVMTLAGSVAMLSLGRSAAVAPRVA